MSTNEQGEVQGGSPCPWKNAADDAVIGRTVIGNQTKTGKFSVVGRKVRGDVFREGRDGTVVCGSAGRRRRGYFVKKASEKGLKGGFENRGSSSRINRFWVEAIANPWQSGKRIQGKKRERTDGGQSGGGVSFDFPVVPGARHKRRGGRNEALRARGRKM